MAARLSAFGLRAFVEKKIQVEKKQVCKGKKQQQRRDELPEINRPPQCEKHLSEKQCNATDLKMGARHETPTVIVVAT